MQGLILGCMSAEGLLLATWPFGASICSGSCYLSIFPKLSGNITLGIRRKTENEWPFFFFSSFVFLFG